MPYSLVSVRKWDSGFGTSHVSCVEFASFSEGSNNTGESLCNNVDLRSMRNGRGLVCCHLYLYVMKVQGGSRS